MPKNKPSNSKPPSPKRKKAEDKSAEANLTAAEKKHLYSTEHASWKGSSPSNSQEEDGLIAKLIKAIMKLLGLKLGSGKEPSPEQVTSNLQHPDAVNRAKNFFSSKAVTLALKSKWVAGKTQEYLDARPDIKEAIQKGLKDNPELCKLIKEKVKDTPMAKVAEGLLPSARQDMSPPDPTKDVHTAALAADAAVKRAIETRSPQPSPEPSPTQRVVEPTSKSEERGRGG
ncbi:MAG: hypothetical protein NTW94_09700 [Legionellales bacterium]|nr:hypothetical protein [Legionellales bacterium]